MTQAILDIVDYFHLDATETTTHLDNVKQLTASFLEQLTGLTEDYKQAVINASMLHDIGKASIPKPILYKKGDLNETERFIIETHPLTGMYLLTKVLAKIDLLQTPEENAVMKHVILYHHERWDGAGYPHGLKGEAIPLESRVVAIVDVYDALTSKRSYKAAWTKQEALQFIQQESGKMFDPELVATFIQMSHVEKNVQKNH